MKGNKKIKVAIFSNDDPTSNILFHKLYGRDDIQITGVYFATGVRPKERNMYLSSLRLLKRMSKRYWFFLAATNFSYKLYEGLLLRLPFIAKHFYPIPSQKQLCVQHKIPYKFVVDFNSAPLVDELKSQQVDLVLARIPTILKKDILDLPQHGVWVPHSSLLPSFRGIAGEFHAMRTNQPIGTTVFRANEILDKGTILYQQELVTNFRSCFARIIANNYLGSQLVDRAIQAVIHDGNTGGSLSTYPDSYVSWPSGCEMNTFYQRNHILFSFREFFHAISAPR
jgi:hypothetical protein